MSGRGPESGPESGPEGGADTLRAALHRMLGDAPARADPRVRVGVDLVHVPRAADLARRHGERWLADQFTPREREQLAAATGTPAATLAGRLAAKEAFLKLLTPERELIPLRDIEVLRAPGGAPTVHPRAAALHRLRAQRLTHWTLSITHEGDWAVAVTAALTSPTP
ncbi:holo-ACP synthase [Kitasatospora cineracea]